MADLPPPSRDPLLPPSAPASRPVAADRPLPPPGTRTGTSAPSAREERLAALQNRPRSSAGGANRPSSGGRGPVKAATVARWRRTWRARVIATTGAVAGVVGGTAVLAHSINADKVVEDASTDTTPLESFDDTTTAVPAVTAPSVSVGTLPVTTPTTAATTAATTTATAAAPATEATVPATEATVPATEATVPETEATVAATQATRATTATTAARSQQRTRQQQPASRSSGS